MLLKKFGGEHAKGLTAFCQLILNHASRHGPKKGPPCCVVLFFSPDLSLMRMCPEIGHFGKPLATAGAGDVLLGAMHRHKNESKRVNKFAKALRVLRIEVQAAQTHKPVRHSRTQAAVVVANGWRMRTSRCWLCTVTRAYRTNGRRSSAGCCSRRSCSFSRRSLKMVSHSAFAH